MKYFHIVVKELERKYINKEDLALVLLDLSWIAFVLIHQWNYILITLAITNLVEGSN